MLLLDAENMREACLVVTKLLDDIVWAFINSKEMVQC